MTEHAPSPGRRGPMRADSERTVEEILRAAERVLAAEPTAGIARIATEAGVARTTVHRRFANREELVSALVTRAAEEFDAAVRAARPDTAPPLIALHQATTNVLRVKFGWSFGISHVSPTDPRVAEAHAHVSEHCTRLFRRARDGGVLRADVDLDWAQRVYYALIDETFRGNRERGTAPDADALATRVVDTLLSGLGSAAGGPAEPGGTTPGG